MNTELDEQSRLDSFKSYNILDTLPETDMDLPMQPAASLCETPVAVVSPVDEGRQWFKSAVGLDLRETSRATALCAQAIRSLHAGRYQDWRISSEQNRLALERTDY